MSIIKVKTGGITADAVTDALIADDVVGTEHLTANEVDTAALGADAVTGAQLADDAVNSEHYTDGSIDTAHLADGQVTTAKLATAVFTGATDIGADLADADLILVDDGAGGTIRKAALSRIKTYAGGNNTPAFRAKLSSASTVANDTATVVVFGSEAYDTDSAYNTSDGKFTVPSGKGGKYVIMVNLRFSSATSNRNAIDIKVNNSSAATSAFEWLGQNQYGTLGGVDVVDLSAGDYVNVEYYQSSGGGIEIRAESFFAMHKLL